MNHHATPYKQWQWLDLGTYLGSPVMAALDNSNLLIAGRQWLSGQPKTVVARLSVNQSNAHLATPTITETLVLPSAGDNAYPGLVINNNTAWLSYYSQHKHSQHMHSQHNCSQYSNRRCQIYLADISL